MLTKPFTEIRSIVLKPDGRLFEPINDLLIIITAIGNALSQVSEGAIHLQLENNAELVPAEFEYGIVLPTGKALRVAVAGNKPDSIEIVLSCIEQARKPFEIPSVSTNGLQTVIMAVGQPIFLMFFERYNVWLNDNLGDAVNWPMTLNFARVVRNAIAHGKINIRAKSAPAVTWKGLSYSHADSGRTIIGTDLNLGDLVGLMIECDEELDRIGAPIL